METRLEGVFRSGEYRFSQTPCLEQQKVQLGCAGDPCQAKSTPLPMEQHQQQENALRAPRDSAASAFEIHIYGERKGRLERLHPRPAPVCPVAGTATWRRTDSEKD